MPDWSTTLETVPLSAKSSAAAITIAYPTAGRRSRPGSPGMYATSATLVTLPSGIWAGRRSRPFRGLRLRHLALAREGRPAAGRRDRLRPGDQDVSRPPGSRGRRPLAVHPRRGDLLPRRPVGRRQDDRDEARQPPRRAHVRRRPPRRRERPGPRPGGAPAWDRLRDPAGRPLPAPDRRGERRD